MIDPRQCDVRVLRRFLWWPKTINGERRWLCRASWLQQFIKGWVNVKWVEAEYTREDGIAEARAAYHGLTGE